MWLVVTVVGIRMDSTTIDMEGSRQRLSTQVEGLWDQHQALHLVQELGVGARNLIFCTEHH